MLDQHVQCRALFVTMSPSTMTTDPTWAAWIDHVRLHGTVLGKDHLPQLSGIEVRVGQNRAWATIVLMSQLGHSLHKHLHMPCACQILHNGYQYGCFLLQAKRVASEAKKM